MQKNTLHHMEQYTKRNQQRRIWQKIVRLLGCAVVFCTTYALILPAITMEHTSCGLEEHSHNMNCYRKIDTVDPEMALSLLCTKESLGIHVHDGSCYDAKENIVCGYADYVAHEHLDLCYDGAGNLICNLPEVILHVHTEDCYLDVQNPEAASHTHTAACYSYEKSQLICTEPEVQGHIHDADCYPDGQFAETLIDESDKIEIFDETCAPVYGLMEVDGHRHDDSCYVQIEVLSCGYDDIASCGESVLICHKPEVQLHIHEDSCFGTCLDEDNQEITELVCTETEIREHVHTEKCFGTVGGHSDLTCTIPEGNEHKHTELCYGTWQLICELPEHVHEEGYRHRKETEEDTINIEETESDTVVSEAETKVGMGAAETETKQESSSEMQNEMETEGTIEVPESETELVNETQSEVPEEKLVNETQSEVLSKESENETQSEVTEESETEKESEIESEVIEAENGTLTCGLTEHAHTDACYEESELVCEQVEHAHTLSCYADASADTNYIVGEDGEAILGYTHYGAWYGEPYGDWCAMFVSFCLHYADVQGIPFESACDRWITELSAERVNLYRTAGEYEPTAAKRRDCRRGPCGYRSRGDSGGRDRRRETRQNRRQNLLRSQAAEEEACLRLVS